MIVGCGIDLVEIVRIENLIGKYDHAFLEKVYTAAEINDCPGKAKTGLHYAGRWAAKEAFFKALPDHCQKIYHFKSVQILGSGSRPELVICDGRLFEAARQTGISVIHCSISHERDLCVAVVILEKVQEGNGQPPAIPV